MTADWSDKHCLMTSTWNESGLYLGNWRKKHSEDKPTVDGKNRNECTAVTENETFTVVGMCWKTVLLGQETHTHKIINCKHWFAWLARRLTQTNTVGPSCHSAVSCYVKQVSALYT